MVERDVLTEKEAMAIRAEAEASLEEYGLVMAGSTEGEVGEAAEIWVVADPGGAGQAIMDERFGPGSHPPGAAAHPRRLAPNRLDSIEGVRYSTVLFDFDGTLWTRAR